MSFYAQHIWNVSLYAIDIQLKISGLNVDQLYYKALMINNI